MLQLTCSRRTHALRVHHHDWFGRSRYQYWTCVVTSPSEVLNPRTSCPRCTVATCGRGDASHGLFVTSPCRSGKPPQHVSQGFRSRPVELPYAPDPKISELYGLAASAWVKVSVQSELMDPSSASFTVAACFAGWTDAACCNWRGHIEV